MLSAAGPIVGRIRRYYIMYETTIKFQLVVFIFDPEKSVVLFSHPTQPTHEFGDLDKPRTYWLKGQDLYIKGPRTLQYGVIDDKDLLIVAYSTAYSTAEGPNFRGA